MKLTTLSVLAAAVAWAVPPMAAQEPAARPLPGVDRAADMLLKVHPTNPRYFTDSSGKAIYLTGAHTWDNLLDSPPAVFDYPAYLDLLQKNNHNFIRLWRWEIFTEREPQPWKRTGPGNALDGKPQFDLNELDQAYFDRLRSRVVAARERGIYVSITLFEGWALRFRSFDGHPFHVKNNINGINGDPDGNGKGTEAHTLQIPAVTSIQEAYVRKVIDTVYDLPNVLYEIANESPLTAKIGGSPDWQHHMIKYVKDYESKKPKQHPVGMTSQGSGEGDSDWDLLMKSPADWISPDSDKYDFKNDPSAATGQKVIIADTDHLWGVGGDRTWAWKTFLRGHHPIWMDPYTKDSGGFNRPNRNLWNTVAPFRDSLLRNLGYARRYANKVDLAAMTPQQALASTGYCLANTGSEYLAYQPGSGAFTVNLTAATYRYEWFNPATGEIAGTGKVEAAGGNQSFTPPFSGDAVLYLAAAATSGLNARAEPLEFTITEVAGLRRFGYPVSAALEAPSGVLANADKARLLDATGKEAPSQFTATSQWPDDSVRVLKRGPFNVTVQLGEVRLEYVSSKSWVRITQRAKAPTDLAVNAHFALTRSPLMWDFGVGSWLYGNLGKPGQSARLRQGPADWQVLTGDGAEPSSLYATGKSCEGWGHLADANRVAAFGLTEYGGLDIPNRYGHLPLMDNDPTRPNEAYFKHVDDIIDLAAARGLCVALLPTWGDKVRKAWGKGPEIFNVTNARVYGEFLGNRYKDKPVIWILGGDRSPVGYEAIWRSLPEGLAAGDGGAHLMSYHGADNKVGRGSSPFFHNDAWLGFNMTYSGHAWSSPSYQQIVRDRALAPAKPTLDSEPNYENHPYLADGRPYHSFKKEWDGTRGDAHQMRLAAYWAMLASAAGHTYGCHDIWQFYEEGREPINHANTEWRKAMDFDGARQMGLLRKLFEARPWYRLVPDQTLIAAGQGEGAGYVQAARAEDGSFALAYLPRGGSVTIQMDKLSGRTVAAHWFDPRDGIWTRIGEYANTATREFTSPSSGPTSDWILVLDDKAKGYGDGPASYAVPDPDKGKE